MSGASTTGYSVSVTSKGADKTVFTVTNAGGVVKRTCDQKGKGGCPDDGDLQGTAGWELVGRPVAVPCVPHLVFF